MRESTVRAAIGISLVVLSATVARSAVPYQDAGVATIERDPPLEEATQPTLAAAVRRGVAILADRDFALMDAPANAHVLLSKDVRASDDLPLLDRAARLVAGSLLERSLEVTVLEEIDGGRGAHVRDLGARTVWGLSIGLRDSTPVLRLRASTPAVDPVVVPFADKPWIEDHDWAPAGEESIVFRGQSGLHADPDVARERALADVTARVLRSFTESVVEDAAGWLESRRRRAASDRLARKIVSAPFAHRHVADRFVAAEPRSYGEMYRGHVLVTFTPDEYRALEREWTRQRRAFDSRLGVGGVLLVLALALTGWAYARVDAATKGYLTHWLRLVAVAGIGLLGGALWWNLF